jgi:Ca-activated chloride channel family protein
MERVMFERRVWIVCCLVCASGMGCDDPPPDRPGSRGGDDIGASPSTSPSASGGESGETSPSKARTSNTEAEIEQSPDVSEGLEGATGSSTPVSNDGSAETDPIEFGDATLEETESPKDGSSGEVRASVSLSDDSAASKKGPESSRAKRIGEGRGKTLGPKLAGEESKESGTSIELRGSGRGGGGEGFGRVHGLGDLDSKSSAAAGTAKVGGGRPESTSRHVHVELPETKAKRARARSATGGAAPPAGSDDEPAIHEMVETAADAKSTFAVDVDTGSYTLARQKIESGGLPSASSVRVEEFVNYFDYDYPDPETGPFGVHMEAAPSPFATDDETRLLRVGVQGKRLTRRTRKPAHLTFLIDVSGSMGDDDKLPLVKRALRVLTQNLDERDTVAIGTYAGSVEKVLAPTRDRERILSAIDHLEASGSTAMGSGLKMAYRLAMENHDPDHVNRVVVLSDGDANVGARSHDAILKQIRAYVEQNIRLSALGFGTGNYRDTMMEQLADEGNGNYYYIDSFDEAKRVLGEQLDGTLQVIAKDVKLQVEFEEANVPRYRLIGYENRDVADRNFRNEQVDAGEIGAGHTVTALYEIEVAPEAEGRLATVRVRHKPPKGDDAEEQAFAFEASQLESRLSAASEDFRFATAVAGFAELLRDSPYAEDVSWTLIEEMASATAGRDERRRDFVDLVKRASAIESGRNEVRDGSDVRMKLQVTVPASNALEARSVEAVLERHEAPLRHCYVNARRKGLEATPALVVRFTVGRSGRVTDLESRRRAAEAQWKGCVERAVERLRFPRPSAGSVDVTASLLFQSE